MSKFNLVIKEVVSLLRGAILVNTIINVVIVFLILFLIFSLFNFFPLIFAGIFSLLYFVKTLFKKKFYYTVKLIEEKFPFLKDKLGTAKDTLNDDNYIINELRTEVTKKLRKVNADPFFNIGKIYLKTFIIILVIFVVLISTTNGFIIYDVEKALTKMGFDFNFGDGNPFGGSLFGKTTDAIDYNSGDGLNLEVGTAIDYNDIEDTEENEFKKEEFLSYKELQAIGAKEYNDPITEEEKEVVKNYFNKINEREQ